MNIQLLLHGPPGYTQRFMDFAASSRMTGIRAELGRERPDLMARFLTFEQDLADLHEFSQGGVHLFFTPHGRSHVRKVEQYADLFLGDSQEHDLNATELFILLLAIQLHDLLMIPRQPGDEVRARSTHAIGVEQFLAKTARFNITPHEGRAISEVVRFHHVSASTEVAEGAFLAMDWVDYRKLGAVLSLADICHADSSRAPQIVFDYLSLSQESEWHWLRHMQIGGIGIRGHRLVVSAIAFTPEGEMAVRGYVDLIRQQLQIVRPYFQTVLRAIEDVDLSLEKADLYGSISFVPDLDSIFELLLQGVYSSPYVFLRELVQNSLDATYVRIAQEVDDPAAEYYPEITISWSAAEDGTVSAVRVDDNGTGMDIVDVRTTLLTIARSTVDNTAVSQLLQRTGKSLIASFGIGLLSCLKVGASTDIRTERKGKQPIRATIESLRTPVKVVEASRDEIGTTVIVTLSKPMRENDLLRAVRSYFRDIRQAQLRVSTIPDSEQLARLNRSQLFALSRAEGREPAYYTPTEMYAATEVISSNLDGWIWLEKTSVGAIVEGAEGRLDVMKERSATPA